MGDGEAEEGGGGSDVNNALLAAWKDAEHILPLVSARSSCARGPYLGPGPAKGQFGWVLRGRATQPFCRGWPPDPCVLLVRPV